MNVWVRFFFGTPTRLFVWLVLAGLVTVMVAPGLLALALGRLVSEVFGPLATLAILCTVVYGMLKALVGGGGGGRKRRN